jgi:Family of unknown function (DUF5419)
MTFEVWMTVVNERIASVLLGLDSDDIPDWGYWDAWNDGVNPNEAACEALKEAGMTDADEYFSG